MLFFSNSKVASFAPATCFEAPVTFHGPEKFIATSGCLSSLSP